MRGFDEDVSMLEEEFERSVEDVDPDELRALVERSMDSADRTPALLCLLSSRLATPEPSVEEAAGIQFVHAGLQVTRGLLEDDSSWIDAAAEPEREDLDLLAADILVTMGFDRLIDDYRRVTEVVNTFGSSHARHLGENQAERESIVDTYAAAVDVGHPGEPPAFLVEFAEKLALENRRETPEPVEKQDGEWSEEFDEPVYDYVREIRMESAAGGSSTDS